VIGGWLPRLFNRRERSAAESQPSRGQNILTADDADIADKKQECLRQSAPSAKPAVNGLRRIVAACVHFQLKWCKERKSWRLHLADERIFPAIFFYAISALLYLNVLFSCLHFQATEFF
jgi:hypothetical protein